MKHLKIRNALANMGKELTPAEAAVLTEQLEAAIESVTPDMAIWAADTDEIEEDVKGVILYINKLKGEGRL